MKHPRRARPKGPDNATHPRVPTGGLRHFKTVHVHRGRLTALPSTFYIAETGVLGGWCPALARKVCDGLMTAQAERCQITPCLPAEGKAVRNTRTHKANLKLRPKSKTEDRRP
jgi:hypothetical protein